MVVLFLLISLPSCMVQVPGSTSWTNALAQELQGVAEQSSLLFWSTFDFSIDAALQSVGPVDSYLLLQQHAKKNNEGDDCRNPHDTSVNTCQAVNNNWRQTSHSRHNHHHQHNHLPVFDLEEFMDSVGESVGSVVKNLSSVFHHQHHHQQKQQQKQQQQQHKGQEQEQEQKQDSPLSIPRGGGATNMFGLGTEQYVYSLYQKGDGSDKDPDGIPTRYLAMHKGNRELAQKSLEATLQWRRDNDIDHILLRPHPKFDQAKAVCPHYFLGRDKKGDVIFLQRPALMDFPRAKKMGLTHHEMLLHYVYVNEYLWQVMEGHKPLGTMTSILDLTGLQISILRRRDILAFVKQFVQTMDSHYPQRAHKTLILNAPKWVNALYKLCAPLMRETTKAKIEIHSVGRKQDEALKKYLPEHVRQALPASFWSKNNYNNKDKDYKDHKDKNNKNKKRKDDSNTKTAEPEDAFHSKLEDELRSFVLARLKDARKKMLPVTA
ncbi:hypothetical protein ACA910_019206 [Epithemia clementina (nom. ined.)]